MALSDLISRGELAKMQVDGYDWQDEKDISYDGTPAASTNVAINPETLTVGTNIQYEAVQPTGSTGATQKFKAIQPADVKFELLFDSTGVLQGQGNLSNPLGGEVDSVPDQIKLFRDVAFKFEGSTHRPRAVKLTWGSFIFKGVVKNWSVTYTLFDPNGTPIRARGSLSIVESVSDTLRLSAEDKNSPDLTHIRQVIAGDTLPMMCQRIYGDSKYYMQVAEFNRLNDFRNLQAGTKLYFPPLAEQTA